MGPTTGTSGIAAVSVVLVLHVAISDSSSTGTLRLSRHVVGSVSPIKLHMELECLRV